MSGRIRTIATWVVGVLAVLALTASTVAVWARVTAASNDKFGDIAADVLDDAVVQEALSDRIATEVLDAVGLENILQSVLVGPLAGLERLESTIADGVQKAVSSRVQRLLDSERVQDLVARAVERAHAAALEVLRGDGLVDGITVSDDTITLNLLPLVSVGLTQLQELGVLQNVQLPELARDGDPDEQIAALSEALGRDLRPDFGQVVVYQGDRVAEATASLEQAQRAVAVGLRAIWLLVALTVVLIAATLLLARERWHALLALSLAVVAAHMLLRAAIHRVVDEAPHLAARPAGANTISIALDGLTTGLLRLSAVVIAIGIVCTVLSIVRRGTRRGDLELAAAVAVGVIVVALLGITIVSLIIGIVAAVATVVVSRKLIDRTPGPGSPVPDEAPAGDGPGAVATTTS